jgi:hypothetical protein
MCQSISRRIGIRIRLPVCLGAGDRFRSSHLRWAMGRSYPATRAIGSRKSPKLDPWTIIINQQHFIRKDESCRQGERYGPSQVSYRSAEVFRVFGGRAAEASAGCAQGGVGESDYRVGSSPFCLCVSRPDVIRSPLTYRYMMCLNKEDLYERAVWDGVEGTSRRQLLGKLQGMSTSLSNADISIHPS